MAADPRPKLLAAVKRAQANKDKANKVADASRVVYRQAIVKALDGGIGQTQLARELRTSASRVREDAMRGRLESTSGRGGPS